MAAEDYELDIALIQPEATVEVSENHARIDAGQVGCNEHAVKMGGVFVYVPLGYCRPCREARGHQRLVLAAAKDKEGFICALPESVSSPHLAALDVQLNRMARRAVLEDNRNFSFSTGQVFQRSNLQELQLLQSQEIGIAAEFVQIGHRGPQRGRD